MAHEAKFTPGPWVAVHDGASVWGEDGARGQIAACRWFVADSGELAGECVQDIHTARSNARLIAAAPELFRVALLLVKACDEQHGYVRDALDAARAAIAKATGAPQ